MANATITYNVQPREENAYLVPEGDLDLLGQFSFMSTLLLSLAGMAGTIAVTAYMNITGEWTAQDCAVVYGSGFVAVALVAWCIYELRHKNSMIARIKKRPKPKSENGD